MLNKIQLGHLGQSYVVLELAKQGIMSIPIAGNNMQGFGDILLPGNICAEIKTSMWSEDRFKSTVAKDRYYGGFSFGMLKRSQADIYIFVLIEPDLSVYKYIWCNKTAYMNDVWNYRRSTAAQREQHHLSGDETPLPAAFYEGFTQLLPRLTQ